MRTVTSALSELLEDGCGHNLELLDWVRAPGGTGALGSKDVYVRHHLRLAGKAKAATPCTEDRWARDLDRAFGRWWRTEDSEPVSDYGPGVRRRTSDGLLLITGAVTARVPCWRPRAMPGWLVTTGRAGSAATGQERLYLNMRPATALRSYVQVLQALDAERVPFTAKTVRDPAHLGRADAAVVYSDLPWSGSPALLAVLEALPVESCDPQTAGFSREIRPGVGTATSDSGALTSGESFGQGAARLLFSALFGADAAQADHDTRLLAQLLGVSR